MLNACDNDVEDLFAPLIGHVQIVKDVAAWGVYWPQFGVNTLGEVVPGKAYFVLVDEDVEVEFPVCVGDQSGLKQSGTLTDPPAGGLSGLGINKTPLTHTVAIPVQAISGIAEGSIISIYNQYGLCCGAAVYQNQNLALTAFGDDPTTPAVDGMTEGEPLHFRIINPETGKAFALEVVYDEQMPQGGAFVNHGLSAVKEMKATGVDEIADLGLQVSVYPNPTSGICHATLTGFHPARAGLSGFEWEVSNAHGSIIATGKTQSDDSVIDLSAHPKGIYYLKIKQRGWQTVEKLVVH